MKMKSVLPFVVGLSLAGSALASNPYFQNAPQGWHWNNEPTKKVVRTSFRKKPHHKTIVMANLNPVQQVKAIHQALIMAKDLALEDQTPQNIARYMAIQQWVYRQATRFSKNWVRTLLLYPQYNYVLKHPTATFVNQVKLSDQHKNEARLARVLAKKDMLFYFYRGQNPLDQEASKSVIPFAQNYGFNLVGASMDGHALKTIPTNINGNTDYKAFGLKALPALVLVNPQTGKHTLFSYGYPSQNGILRRLHRVVTDFGKHVPKGMQAVQS